MRKTKVVSVALLSLLVVFSPVASAVAQSRTVKTEEQQSDQSQQASSVFREIEARGGQEVDDERLEEVEGELGPVSWAGIGAAAGAAGYGVDLGLSDRSFSWRDLGTSMVAGSASTLTSYGMGAVLSTSSSAAAAAGTVVSNAVGSAVSNLTPWS